MGRAGFDSTAFFERGGVKVAGIGQHFPYTPIANPRHMVEGWSFGIRADQIQANVDAARVEGAEIVVLLSHNGFDVDQKIAATISGIDVILTGKDIFEWPSEFKTSPDASYSSTEINHSPHVSSIVVCSL